MWRPISALAWVSGLRSRSKRPANGLSMIAATATLRSGGSTVWPASIADLVEECQRALDLHRFSPAVIILIRR